ncbi:MAG TPA: DinB family protein [Candidatus Sulfopaludibacter sp.]|jgi:uncharacterized damage-inducible protein DinB|nr:DinB family protein [Candidatus Sulfopaludibacter sp.]
MNLSVDLLRHHIDYSAWASQRLVLAAAELTEEELTHDFRTADHTVLETLVHTFAADRLWLSRLSGSPHPGFITDADRHLSALQNDWPPLHHRWQEWAAGLTNSQALEPLAYTDMKGRHWNQPIWQLVLHVVNHATHHRGQVVGFLRSLGHAPPPTDLTVYYREVTTSLPTPSA